jgi:hypothetical protein
MNSGLFDSPEIQNYIKHAQKEMIPMMENSAIVISLLGSHIDAKVCLEIGAAILLDKPIVVVIVQGAKVPANLKRVASIIIEGDMKEKATQDKLQQAIARVMKNDART